MSTPTQTVPSRRQARQSLMAPAFFFVSVSLLSAPTTSIVRATRLQKKSLFRHPTDNFAIVRGVKKHMERDLVDEKHATHIRLHRPDGTRRFRIEHGNDRIADEAWKKRGWKKDGSSGAPSEWKKKNRGLMISQETSSSSAFGVSPFKARNNKLIHEREVDKIGFGEKGTKQECDFIIYPELPDGARWDKKEAGKDVNYRSIRVEENTEVDYEKNRARFRQFRDFLFAKMLDGDAHFRDNVLTHEVRRQFLVRAHVRPGMTVKVNEGFIAYGDNGSEGRMMKKGEELLVLPAHHSRVAWGEDLYYLVRDDRDAMENGNGYDKPTFENHIFFKPPDEGTYWAASSLDISLHCRCRASRNKDEWTPCGRHQWCVDRNLDPETQAPRRKKEGDEYIADEHEAVVHYYDTDQLSYHAGIVDSLDWDGRTANVQPASFDYAHNRYQRVFIDESRKIPMSQLIFLPKNLSRADEMKRALQQEEEALGEAWAHRRKRLKKRFSKITGLSVDNPTRDRKIFTAYVLRTMSLCWVRAQHGWLVLSGFFSVFAFVMYMSPRTAVDLYETCDGAVTMASRISAWRVWCLRAAMQVLVWEGLKVVLWEYLWARIAFPVLLGLFGLLYHAL